MARSNAGATVAGLTAAALAVVAFFAYQASAAEDRPTAAEQSSPSPSERGTDRPKPPSPQETALPTNSGTGERVVYALSSERVWLVSADGKVTRSYRVRPSTVDPEPGGYTVYSRTEQITGSDGVPIEHVVLFTSVEGTVIGFSAAVDGSLADPDPSQRTGGIRQARADGEALWSFVTDGTKVVVVR